MPLAASRLALPLAALLLGCTRAAPLPDRPADAPRYGAYHVSPDGSDAASGRSRARAFRTVKRGLTQLRPGDTLVLHDGTYVEADLALEGLRATAAHPTVVMAANRWGAKLEGVGQEVVIFRVEDCEHVVVDGLEVYHPGESAAEDWSKGIESFTTDYLTVRNCYVHDCGCGGFSGRTGDYLTFEDNVGVGNARFSPYNCSGLSIYHPHQRDDAPGPHIVIRNNVLFGNECRVPFSVAGFAVPTDGNGIILDDFENDQPLIDSAGSAAGTYTAEVLVEGNLSFGNGGAGIKTYKVANATFRHNTAYHNNYVLAEYGGALAELGFEDVTGHMVAEGNIGVQAFGRPGNALYFRPKGTAEGEGASLSAKRNTLVGNVRVEGAELDSSNVVVGADYQSYVRFADPADTVAAFGSIEELRRRFALREESPALGRGAVAEAVLPEGLPALPPDPLPLGVFHSTPRPITVDGRKDGWYTGPGHAIEPRRLPNRYDSDNRGQWWGAFTRDSLYVYVEVEDRRRQPTDRVAVSVASDPADPSTVREVVLADGGSPDAQGDRGSYRPTAAGYAVELAWSRRAVGLTEAHDRPFGLNVLVFDSDDEPPRSEATAGVATWARLPNPEVLDAPDVRRADTSYLARGVLREVAPPPIIEYASAKPLLDARPEAAYGRAQPIATVLNPNPRGAVDLGGAWRATWTDEALYLYVEVTDDSLDVQRDEPWYNLDGLEVYLDTDNSKTFNGYDRNDFHLYLTPAGELAVRRGQIGEGAVAQTRRTPEGYAAELELPWAALGLAAPADGTFLGLDVHLTDDDDGGRRDSKLSWHATLDQAYQNAALFGTVVLGRGQ